MRLASIRQVCAISWALSQKPLRATISSSSRAPLMAWALIRLITVLVPSRLMARWIELMRLDRP
ncbi:hypothetical protein D3C77_762290 [compost metagenome]